MRVRTVMCFVVHAIIVPVVLQWKTGRLAIWKLVVTLPRQKTAMWAPEKLLVGRKLSHLCEFPILFVETCLSDLYHVFEYFQNDLWPLYFAASVP